jgi:hypothetical protein
LATQVLLPIGMISRNPSMKKFAKNWISSAKFYLLCNSVAKKMVQHCLPSDNQVAPLVKGQPIFIIDHDI